MTKITPLSDQILVEAIEEKIETGGLIIPESSQNKDKPMRGKIIATGPGKLDEKGNRVPMEVKTGDQVLFSKYSPTEIKVDGQELLILESKAVLAKIE